MDELNKASKAAEENSQHWSQTAKRDWFNTFFMIFLPVLAVIATTAYFMTEEFNYWMIPVFLFFYFATGLSITAGYHRLFSHKGYEAHPIIQFLYLFFGAGAFQNSALKWCTDHRVHHMFVDKEDDPYSVNQGLWHAHVGWVCHEGNPKDFSHLARDLAKNPLIQWQYRNCLWLGIASGVVLPTLVGWAFGSALGGFALAGVARIVLVHHVTFFINSLCHYWGKQTYTDRNSAKDNFILAFFTYGEGFHNFHHHFSNDYRNGIRWFDFDPTKWMIRTLAYLGFADKLRVTPQIQILRAKLEMRRKRLESLTLTEEYGQALRESIEQMRTKVETAYIQWGELKEKYKSEYAAFKKEKTEAGKAKIALLKAELKMAQREYRMAIAQWSDYTSVLMQLAPARI